MTAITDPARVHLRLRADAKLHAAEGASFRVIALTPILAPSLLSAISFIQWFGNQGVLKWHCWAASQVYGPHRHHHQLRSTRCFRTR